jgi:ApaG protein
MISSIATTDGIQVKVDALFRPEHSSPSVKTHIFSYKIRITNNSAYHVQLLKRHWFIFDSCGEYREVEGEGVIGLQPVIEQGMYHEYESACSLATDIGSMKGYYIFKRLVDDKQFSAIIPEFHLIAPYRLN